MLGNRSENLIDLDTLRLVTDVNVFNEHPWGKKGFDCFSQFIGDFREWNPDKQSYQIGGFYNVLQVLVLEIFPGLANYYA